MGEVLWPVLVRLLSLGPVALLGRFLGDTAGADLKISRHRISFQGPGQQESLNLGTAAKPDAAYA